MSRRNSLFDVSTYQHQLNGQLASLSREVAHISQNMRHLGSGAGREVNHFAHGLADTAWHQGAVAARVLGRQATKAGRAVGKDPLPAIVAVAGLACLATVIMSSGKSRRR
jgi:hypothetical protein